MNSFKFFGLLRCKSVHWTSAIKILKITKTISTVTNNSVAERCKKACYHQVFYLLETDVYNQQCNASAEHSNVRIIEQLNDDPSHCNRYAQTSHDHRRATPMVRSESSLPIQARAAAHIVRTIANFASQQIVTRRWTLYQPTPQAIVMYTRYVTGASAWLYQRFRFVCIVTNPTFFVSDESIAFRTRRFRTGNELLRFMIQPRQ